MIPRLHSALILAFLAAGAPAASAQESPNIAAKVPAEVTEVITGGNWSKDDVSGVFRAIAVTTPNGDGTQVDVIMQMLALGKGNATPKVTKTILVKEIAEKKLANALLDMNVENDNELTLIITSYDQKKDEETVLQLNFDSTGKYEILAAPKEEPAPASGAGTKEK
jgi:2-oxoglutarate dehydrogenase complex dehydrogenase (E1) component-like enzyme